MGSLLPIIHLGNLGMHSKMNVCHPDKVCKRITGSTLFYINSLAMVFRSDHPVGWKSKSKLNICVWTIIIALNVVWKAAWHWTIRSALNSRYNTCNTCSYIPIHPNTYLIHTTILITCECIHNTCQHIPKYMLICILGEKTSVLHQKLIHWHVHTGFCLKDMDWHVLWYVLDKYWQVFKTNTGQYIPLLWICHYLLWICIGKHFSMYCHVLRYMLFKYWLVYCYGWVKNRGLDGILGKMRPCMGKMKPIWALCGQDVQKKGRSALELGESNTCQ